MISFAKKEYQIRDHNSTNKINWNCSVILKLFLWNSKFAYKNVSEAANVEEIIQAQFFITETDKGLMYSFSSIHFCHATISSIANVQSYWKKMTMKTPCSTLIFPRD